MTSTKTLIIFAHRPTEAVKTHQCYALLFFSLAGKKEKKEAQLIVKTVTPFKETGQYCGGRGQSLEGENTRTIGYLLNTHSVGTQY